MTNLSRGWSLLIGSVALVGCTGDQPEGSGGGTSARTASPATQVGTVSPVAAAIALRTTPLAVDELGIPRLLRGAGAPARPAATPGASARLHVAHLAPAWGVRGGAVPTLEELGDVPVTGGTVSRLRQLVDGLPIEDGELRVMTGSGGELIAASGLLRAADAPRTAHRDHASDDAEAVARAIASTYKATFSAKALVAKDRAADGTRLLTGHAGDVVVSLARAYRAWHPTSRAPGAPLVAAWIVEAYARASVGAPDDAFRVVLAEDGRVLSRRSLVADAAFSYRVFAETAAAKTPLDGPLADASPNVLGQPGGVLPPYVAPSLVTVDGLNHPGGLSVPDPWLAAGATETSGNNADAYADFNDPNGLSSGDFRASTTAAGAFDRTYNPLQAPMTSTGQQMAGVTSLFYVVNWMHDFWYDGGFTEVAGNAQVSNYGRGGVEGDPMFAEAQDAALAGQRNNANMATPDDGMNPRMQVYLWSARSDQTLSVAGRTPPTGSAGFGPTSFSLTAGLVLAADGVGVTTDACTALQNNVTGKIVLADRGSCSFKTKAAAIQAAGGIGMILADNAVSTSPPPLGGDPNVTTTITIGSVSVTKAEGDQLKADLQVGAVTATMTRQTGPELDGALDASVIGHEFGHMVHHRLSVCGTPFCGAMSEGWADFSALLMVSRDGDNLMGAYPLAIYAAQSFSASPEYFGIRRAPYSANHAINALSFRHMATGEATPTTHPFLASGNNAEVHNAGEVWASMLWEGYIALRQAGGTFDEVRLKMRKYVVAGLLIAPPDATPTETRDAILTAAHAASPADHDVLAAAYARRGFGSCAVSAPRDSDNFAGIVESADVKGNALAGVAELALVTKCDADSVLDGGETATIQVPVVNAGAGALTNVVVTLATTTPGVTITTPSVTFATLAPYAMTSATFELALADTATTPLAGDFKVTLASPSGCTDTRDTAFSVGLNTDDVPASSATDTFEAGSSVWTAVGTPGVWDRQRTPAGAQWVGVDRSTQSDASLVSPPMVADATTPVTVTFSHAYAFEFSSNTYWDGGVIEVSIDGGTTWDDVTTRVATSPYNATITNTGQNPLPDRAAFGNTNPAYPARDTVALDFGTQLAGKTFQLRFRVASDAAAGAPGWQIDDVAVTGLVGTPFPTVIADAGSCTGGPDAGTDPGAGDGGCCQTGRFPAGNAAAALGALALLLRRRRRRA